MDSTESSMHRLFFQEDFAESLQVLSQLSTQVRDTQSAEATDPYYDFSWEDAVADVENFLQHSTDPSSSAKSK